MGPNSNQNGLSHTELKRRYRNLSIPHTFWAHTENARGLYNTSLVRAEAFFTGREDGGREGTDVGIGGQTVRAVLAIAPVTPHSRYESYQYFFGLFTTPSNFSCIKIQ
jgi:hypothetical protein